MEEKTPALPDFYETVEAARRPVVEALADIAQIWALLGLSKEEVIDRVRAIETRLRAAAESVLEAEQNYAKREQRKLAIARDEALGVAEEVGEALQVGKSASVREQLQKIHSEQTRLEALFFEQSKNVEEMSKRITAEARQIQIDDTDYLIPASLTGIAAVRVGKEKLRLLEETRKSRATQARKNRKSVIALKKEYGNALVFRLALDGELIGSSDGTVVLDRTDENQAMLRTYLASYEREERDEVLASAPFIRVLGLLEKEYLGVLVRGQSPLRESCERFAKSDDESVVSVESAEASVPGNHRRKGSSQACCKRHRGETHKRNLVVKPRRLRRHAEKAMQGQRSRDLQQDVRDLSCDGKRCRARSRSRTIAPKRGFMRARLKLSKRETPSGRRRPSREKRSMSVPRRTSEDVESCRDALRSMQGKWIDKKGVTYTIDDQHVRRDDGRRFPLFVKRDAIEWGIKSSYYAKPAANCDREVRWFNARTRAVAWIWERP